LIFAALKTGDMEYSARFLAFNARIKHDEIWKSLDEFRNCAKPGCSFVR
jgi:hypothetical protein